MSSTQLSHRVLLLLVFTIVATVVSAVKHNAVITAPEEEDGCVCQGDDCGCCAAVDIPDISLNVTACAYLTYLPKTMAMAIVLEFDGKVVMNSTVVSLLDPSICVGIPIPVVSYLVQVCFDFYNMDYTSTDVSGCFALGFKVVFITIATVDVGCFSFPTEDSGNGQQLYNTPKNLEFFCNLELGFQEKIEVSVAPEYDKGVVVATGALRRNTQRHEYDDWELKELLRFTIGKLFVRHLMYFTSEKYGTSSILGSCRKLKMCYGQ